MAMGCDFWTLQKQPRRFVELYKLYLQIQSKVQDENERKSIAEMKKARGRKSRAR